MTKTRMAELLLAGVNRGRNCGTSVVESADFCFVDVPALTWGELRELIELAYNAQRRVG